MLRYIKWLVYVSHYMNERENERRKVYYDDDDMVVVFQQIFFN